MRVGTLSSSLCWGPLSGGRCPYVHGGEGTAPIKEPANPSVQISAGSHIPSGKPAPGTRLKTQSKGELGAAELGAAFESGRVLQWELGHLAVLREHGREQFAGASSASRELKQLEPEARSETSTPGTRGHPLCCLAHPPASPAPRAAEVPQGLAPFHAGNMTFPLGRGLGSAEIRVCFFRAGSQLPPLPVTLRGRRSGLWLLSLMGAGGAGAVAPAGWQQRDISCWRYL